MRSRWRTQNEAAASATSVAAVAKELGYQESSTVQTGISTATDITGLTLTFTVVAGRPVYVEAILPYVLAVTAAWNGFIQLTDGSGVVTSKAVLGATTAAFEEAGVVRERIMTAGTYTRKVQVVRFSGAGTLTVNSDATTIASIRALQFQS